MLSDRPLHELIADHKHSIISRIKKVTEGTTAVKQAEIKKIIVTKPRIGYTLNLDSSDVWILGR